MKYVRIERPDVPAGASSRAKTSSSLSKPPYEELEYNGGRLPLSQCRLLAPCEPTKIVCVGKTMRSTPRSWEGIPWFPVLFLKGPNTLNRPEGAVHAPDLWGGWTMKESLRLSFGAAQRT